MAAPTREEHWLPARAFENALSLQLKAMRGRGVAERDGEGGRVEFEFYSAMSRCRDLIDRRAQASSDGAQFDDAETLKNEKLREEIRKLSLVNDEAEGLLIKASDVEHVWGRKVRAMCDELDAMVSRVKMACPDIPQAVLAVIGDQLAAARNKAADSKTDE